MIQNRRFSISPIVLVFVALALALMFSCSDQPTAVKPESGGSLNGSGNINPATGGSFLLAAVSDTSLGSGPIEVWAMNVAFTESTGIASFDVQLLNRTQRTHSLPIRFVITDIRPADIAVVDFDGTTEDALPFYTFGEQLGGGTVLAPGARTEPVTMKFHTVTARSFAIGFRLDLGPAAGTGTIEGTVYLDNNQNGVRDRECRCEPGIPGIAVALERTLENGDKVTFLALTDSNGVYRFAGLREGSCKVFAVAPEDLWKVTTANPLLVTLVKGADGKVQDFLGADFGFFSLKPPIPPITNLFGPIIIGPPTPFGTELDSTFINPPSPLTVIYKYYLEVKVPLREMCFGFNVVDSAEAWINDKMVFTYRRENLGDTTWAPYRFKRQLVELPDSLMITGENAIRLIADGDECAALEWKVSKAVPVIK
jgi:hypothetical protein